MLRVDDLKLGRISINGRVYIRDIVITNNLTITLRESRSSEALRERYGHTPMTTAENIPWGCEKLVIGTGVQSRLFIMDEVRVRAHEMGVKLITMPTSQAIRHINDPSTNLILHIVR
jgi:hypothetical protein